MSRKPSHSLLLALLQGTKERREVELDDIVKQARQVTGLALEQLEGYARAGFLILHEGKIRVNAEQRLGLALEAISSGLDIERVCRAVRWQEFEEIAEKAFQANSYRTIRHIVFKHGYVRYEVDILAIKEPLILCVDCKHWMHGWHRARIWRAAVQQVDRARAFALSMKALSRRIGLHKWNEVKLLPVLITLADVDARYADGAILVPVLRLRSFLSELSPYGTGFSFIELCEQNHS